MVQPTISSRSRRWCHVPSNGALQPRRAATERQDAGEGASALRKSQKGGEKAKKKAKKGSEQQKRRLI